MDIVTSFLNGTLQEDMYMIEPPGCIQPGTNNLVCKLRCSLYGLKQSPRSWYARIDTDLLRRGLKCTIADSNVYYCRQGNSIIILILYVDDLFITESDSNSITTLKTILSQEFEMKDLGLITKILGAEVTQTS